MRENLPAEGAAILCGNHKSLLDPLAAGVAVGRPVRFMAKIELFRVPVVRGIIRALGAFPVNRGNADMTAVRTSLSVLKEGGVLGIFPQGGREVSGYRGMETGVALIALKSGAPVVPMRFLEKFRLFRRNTLIIGRPVDLSAFSIRAGSEALNKATERIEAAVAALGEPEDGDGDGGRGRGSHWIKVILLLNNIIRQDFPANVQKYRGYP